MDRYPWTYQPLSPGITRIGHNEQLSSKFLCKKGIVFPKITKGYITWNSPLKKANKLIPLKTTEKLFLPGERLSNRILRGSRETSAHICPRLKKLTSKAQKVLQHFLLCPQNSVYILVVDATCIKVCKMNYQSAGFLWIERDIYISTDTKIKFLKGGRDGGGGENQVSNMTDTRM